MNKFLISIFVLFVLFYTFLYFIKLKQEQKQIKKPEGIEIKSELMYEFNKKLKNINKIQSKLNIKQGISHAYGFIAFEKPDNFSMICNSIFGKEIEIGSNKDYFWFYSRNMKPKALYYCSLDEIEKTRLKKIFYPNLLKEFLCVNEIKNQKFKINKDFIYFEEKINLGQEVFDKITIIKNNQIVGYFLFNNNKIILKMEIVEFQKIDEMNLPKKIKINWLEEKIEQEWLLTETEINSNFSNWSMPFYKNKINLVDY